MPFFTQHQRHAMIGLCALMLSLLAVPAFARQPSPPPLYLHSHALAPSAAQPTIALRASAPDLAIVQFGGPLGAAERSALRAAGLEALEYIPDYAFLVRGTPAAIAAAAQLPGVVARLPFTAADKIAPGLLEALAAGTLDAPVALRVRAWPGRSQALANALAARGMPAGPRVSAADLLALAQQPDVRWIEPATPMRIFNDRARAIIGADAVWQNHGLFGQGQIVGIADSGLDTGDMNTLSPDFAGRIHATHILSDGGDLADQFGHGTHVAGSLLGAGMQSGAHPAQHQYNGSFAGVAPEASLVAQAFEVDALGQILGLDDPVPIFAQAYADGARIHSNSWGGPTGSALIELESTFGGYPDASRSTDQFVWEHPDMAIFFAAGNSGNDGYFTAFGCLPFGDGVINPDSLYAPATAKNVITVGASENERADAPRSNSPYRELDPTCYSADPIASDTPSNDRNGMAPFSSRGPADDGRIKPDMVAPGTNILSNRSHVPGANPLWGTYNANPNYVFSGGTSMATPIAAGAGTLVREWLGLHGFAQPSAALLKATLLNTTDDIAPGQYGSGGKREIPTARPNGVDGWGRVALGFIDAPPPFRTWFEDHSAGLATGQTVRYPTSAAHPLLVSGALPLRIVLAWTDPPASLSAARQLVNDLDLVLIGPDGREYWGNAASGGDRINNVEGVIVARPQPGTYRIEVRAHNIPIGTQPYALAVSGALSTGPANTPAQPIFVPVARAR